MKHIITAALLTIAGTAGAQTVCTPVGEVSAICNGALTSRDEARRMDQLVDKREPREQDRSAIQQLQREREEREQRATTLPPLFIETPKGDLICGRPSSNRLDCF